jgi:osmotically-inducible protein OsmY
VLDELKWDTRVRETDIGVEVHDCVVTLTGTVDSWTARLAAQEAAHRVTSVLDVANDIKVKLPGPHERNDTDIAQAVRHALEWDVLVPNERIRTTVSNGIVMLEGEVDYLSEHDDAGRAVRNLTGVCGVRNVITVKPSFKIPPPQAIRAAIVEALERHAERAGEHVRIAVADGKVILSGEVPSWADRIAVEGAVRGTPGVREVESQLQIHAP